MTVALDIFPCERPSYLGTDQMPIEYLDPTNEYGIIPLSNSKSHQYIEAMTMAITETASFNKTTRELKPSNSPSLHCSRNDNRVKENT